METFRADIVLTEDFRKELRKQVHQEVEQAFKEKVRNPSADTEYLKLGQAAAYANISRNTLAKWIRNGLKVTVVNGTKRIRREDADKFMMAHKI